jgi:peptidylprolyl isomerase
MGGEGGGEFGSGLSRRAFVVASAAAAAAQAVGISQPEAAQAARPGMSNTGSGSRVNKDPNSLLRQALPIDCKAVSDLQEAVEAIRFDVYIKNWSRAVNGCQKARGLANGKKKELLAAVKGDKAEGEKYIQAIIELLDPLEKVLKSSEGSGTVAERSKLDEAYKVQAKISDAVGELQMLMVPPEYVRDLEASIPSEYDDLPRLLGRATVEFTLKKPNGAPFDIEGELFDKARLLMVIDGFTSPITGGNFVDLVQKGFYKNLPINRSDGFVVQMGDPDPEGTKHGYGDRTIPLEINVVGDKAPMYGVTTEDDGRGAAATKLPFQAYGALGMARVEYEPDSASSQFFWLLFDSDLTPAGKNLLDGRYAEFGYTIEGADLLKDVKEGDIVVDSRVVSGGSNLKKSKSG